MQVISEVVLENGNQNLSCAYCTTLEKAYQAVRDLCEEHDKTPGYFHIEIINTDVW